MTPKEYRHLFFDLDHTLWDFERNSRDTLRALFEELQLQSCGISDFGLFLERYEYHNKYCWMQYRNGRMDKEEVRVNRFIYALADFQVDRKDLVYTLSDLYVQRSPDKLNLIEGAREVLEALRPAYRLHIITNGFEEVQFRKLRNTGLLPYFDKIITSERAGALKPSPRIFEFALERASAGRAESIYIGDNLEADMLGARNAGMDQVYFNPEARPHVEKVTYEIRSLSELIPIFT